MTRKPWVRGAGARRALRFKPTLWRLQLSLIALSLGAHLPMVLALDEHYFWPALGVMGVLFAGSVLGLLRRCRPDRPRSRWLRYVDELLFVYWATSIFGFALSLLVMVGCLLVAPASAASLVVAAYAIALVTAAWAVLICRRWVRVTHQVVEVTGLPESFERFRVAHLTDLHVGSTDPKPVAAAWVERANRLEPDCVFVTGDLVTSGTAFYSDVCEALGELRAPDGVFLVLGNHDQADSPLLMRILEDKGLRVLDNSWCSVRRGEAELVVAGLSPLGVEPPKLEQTLAGRPAGVVTLLLSHYPDVFEDAREHGVKLVFSGHTHGGQLGLPWLGDRINVASLGGQRPRGLVQCQGAALFVSAGLGTTNVPMRLGVRPEIALLELRAASCSQSAEGGL